jgi:DNA ligase (NAD+)
MKHGVRHTRKKGGSEKEEKKRKYEKKIIILASNGEAPILGEPVIIKKNKTKKLPKTLETTLPIEMKTDVSTRVKPVVSSPVKGRLNEKFIDLMDQLVSISQKQGEPFKARAYQKAQETIMVLDQDLTVENYESLLKNKPGIGETIQKKLKEFVETGTLRLLERERANPVNVLSDIYGVGPKKAKDLVEKGITTIAELRGKKDELLNSVQKVGLKYYEDILARIPRSEIEEYKTILESAFDKVKKSTVDKFEIVGSFRRGAKASGDIDIIITGNSGDVFKAFVDNLVKDKIILEVLSRGPSKCLVVAKIPSSEHARRVDFLYTNPEEFPFSILYFTGSKFFNTVMRGRALSMGYSLNEHGMHKMENKKKGAKVDTKFTDEKSIFDFLKMQYKNPEDRIDGRAVVALPGSPKVSTITTLPIENVKLDIAEPVQEEEEPIDHVPAIDHPDEPIVVKIKKGKLTKEEKAAEKERKKTEKLQEKIALKEAKKTAKIQEKLAAKEAKKTLKMQEKLKAKAEKAANKTIGKVKKIKISNVDVPLTSVIKEEKEEEIANVLLPEVESQDKIADFKKNGIHVLEQLKEADLNKMLIKANDAYYNDGATLLTDNEYDILKEYIERKYPKNQVVKEVGAPVEKNKAILPYQMPSMDKIKPDTGALDSWKKKYKGPYVMSCKLDGVSGMYCLESAKCPTPKLFTRGNGKVGQDVSHLISHIKLPESKDDLVVRGEFIISRATFQKKYKAKFANPRNLVAGIVNRITMDDKVGDLDFVAYEVIKPVLKPSEQMALLKARGFKTVRNETKPDITNSELSDILVDWRTNYEYEIDGIIISDDAVYPRTAGNPDHAFAFKMVLSDQLAEAKVVDVIWNASKDGYLKPRVQIEPIQLGGVKIEYATGFNGSFIETNKIGVGAIIQLVRSGDVIPHIKSVITPAENAKMPDVAYTWNSTHVDVLLEDATGHKDVNAKNITGFFRGIEVDGLSGGNVSRLIEGGFDTVPKIVKMTKADFLSVDGFKEKMAVKLSEGIKAKLEAASLSSIMSASNIFGRGFSDIKIDLILNELGPQILTSVDTDKAKKIAAIKGMALKTALAFVEKIPAFLAFLKECGLEGKVGEAARVEKPAVDESHPLFKKSIVFSGTRDKDLEAMIKSVGASLGTSVSKNTFILITPDPESDTGKVATAKELGITILTPEEFKKLYR